MTFTDKLATAVGVSKKGCYLRTNEKGKITTYSVVRRSDGRVIHSTKNRFMADYYINLYNLKQV